MIRFGRGRYGPRFDDYREGLSRGLLTSGSQLSPVRHWTQGLGRMAHALLGMKMQEQLGEEMDKRTKGKARAIEEMFSETVKGEDYMRPGEALPENLPTMGPETLRPFGETYFNEQIPDTATFTPDQRLALPGLGGINPSGDQRMTTQAQDIATELQHKNSLQGDDPFPYQPPIGPAGGLERTNQIGPEQMDQMQYGPDVMVPGQSRQQLGKLGQALMAMNQNTRGGIDPRTMLSAQMQQENRGYQEGQAKQTRANQLADMATKFGQQKEIQQMKLDAKGAGKPKIVKGADGFNYYADGPQAGTRVLPNVQKPAKTNKKGIQRYKLPDGTTVTRSDLTRDWKTSQKIKEPMEIFIMQSIDPAAAAEAQKKSDAAMPFEEWALRERGIDVRGGFIEKPIDRRALPPYIGTQEEWDALPSGAEFTDESGMVKIKE